MASVQFEVKSSIT